MHGSVDWYFLPVEAPPNQTVEEKFRWLINITLGEDIVHTTPVYYNQNVY